MVAILLVILERKNTCHQLGTILYIKKRLKNQPYSFDSDIWSLGIILLELAQLKYPYDELLKMNDINQSFILQLAIIEEVPMKIPEIYSNNFKDFVSKCLGINIHLPDYKPSTDKLLSHPWIFDKSDSTGYSRK